VTHANLTGARVPVQHSPGPATASATEGDQIYTKDLTQKKENPNLKGRGGGEKVVGRHLHRATTQPGGSETESKKNRGSLKSKKQD